MLYPLDWNDNGSYILHLNEPNIRHVTVQHVRVQNRSAAAGLLRIPFIIVLILVVEFQMAFESTPIVI